MISLGQQIRYKKQQRQLEKQLFNAKLKEDTAQVLYLEKRIQNIKEFLGHV